MTDQHTRLVWETTFVQRGDREYLATQRQLTRAAREDEQAQRSAAREVARTERAREQAAAASRRAAVSQERDSKLIERNSAAQAKTRKQIADADRELAAARLKAAVAGKAAGEQEKDPAVLAALEKKRLANSKLVGLQSAATAARDRLTVAEQKGAAAERAGAQASATLAASTDRTTVASERASSAMRENATASAAASRSLAELNRQQAEVLTRANQEATSLQRVTAARREATVATQQYSTAQATAARRSAAAPVSAAGAVGGAAKAAGQGAGRLSMAGSVAAGTLGAGGLFAVAQNVRDAFDFQEQMSVVQSVAQATDKDLKRLTETAVDLGGKTKFSASESAAAMEVLVKAGFDTDQTIASLPGTLSLAAASGTELATAADIQALSLRAFQLEAREAGHVADVLALAANKSSIDVTDIGESLKYVGPVALAAGQSFEGVNAALAVLGNNGIKASQAGTSLRAIIARLVKPAKPAVEALDEIGLSVEKLQGPDGLLPLPDIVDKFGKALHGLPKADQLRILTAVFGREPLAAVNTLMSKGSGDLREFEAAFIATTDAAEKTSKVMQNNAKAGFEQLGGAIESGAIRALDEFGPKIKDVALDAAAAIDGFTNDDRKMATVGDTIRNVGSAAADTAAPLVTVAKAGAGAVSMFTGLDDGLQQTILHAGALALVSRKLAGSQALGGVVSRLRGVRQEVDSIGSSIESANAVTDRRPRYSVTPRPVSGAGRLTAAQQAATMASLDESTAAGGLARARREEHLASRAATADAQALTAAQSAAVRAERQAATLATSAGLGGASAQRLAAARATHAAAQAEVATLKQRVAIGQTDLAQRRTALQLAEADLATARGRSANARSQRDLAASSAPAAGSWLQRRNEGRALGPIAGYQLTRGLGGTRREAMTDALARAPRPTVTGRGVAGVAAAGGLGAALSGGSVVGAATSAAAVGMMGGPMAAAGAAAVAAGTTALVNELKSQKTEDVEQAAREFGKRVGSKANTLTASGMRTERARDLGRSTETLRAGSEIREYASALDKSGASEDTKRRALGPLAKAAGLDLDALLAGNSDKFRDSARDSLKAFEDELRTHRFADARSLMDGFTASFDGLPRAAQQSAADAMITIAHELESKGRAPEGTVDSLIRRLAGRFDGLVPMITGSAARSISAVDRQLRDKKLSESANQLVGRLADQFKQLPRAAVRSVPGAVATLGSSLRQLEIVAKDKNVSKDLREQAEKQLPGLRKAYDNALGSLAERMGWSKERAKKWADRVVEAARRAGNGRTDVDRLKESVSRLNSRMSSSTQFARDLKQSYEDVGVTASNAAILVKDYTDAVAAGPLIKPTEIKLPPLPHEVAGPPRPEPRKRRRGGEIRAFAAGGHVDAMMSGGEEYLPASVVSNYDRDYPGMLDAIAATQRPHFAAGGPVASRYNFGGHIVPGPSDRDGTYVAAEDGAFVLTGHGRALRDEMLGFAKGGEVSKSGKAKSKKVRAARVGYTVFDDPPPGAFGSLDGGYAELGTATKAGKATNRGWLAKALGLAGELPADTPLTISINGKRGTSRKRDRGYGQGGDDVTSDSDYALDLWKSEWSKFGLSASSKGTATVALGAGVSAEDLSASGTRSTTSTVTTDDLKPMSAATARRQRATLRTPSVDTSSVTQQAREGTYGPVEREAFLAEVLEASRVNLTRTKKTTAGKAGKDGGGSASGSIGGRGKFNWPTTSHKVTSGYGARKAPTKGASSNHDGIDIGAPSGAAVYAAARGKVLRAGVNGGYGNYVELQHRAGVVSFYGHLKEILAAAGATVNSGTKIGTVGSTGTSTGPHLHFGARKGGSSVDPRTLLGKDFRRGGPIRPFAKGGQVGSRRRTARDTSSAVSSPGMRTALRGLYTAGTRSQAPVTDALTELQEALASARRVSAEELEALSVSIRMGIDRTRAKKSAGGAKITKDEAATNRRSRGALSLVDAEILKRSSVAARPADRIGAAIDERSGQMDRSLRRAGISADSETGLKLAGRDLSWRQSQQKVQLGALDHARDIASRSKTAGGRAQVKAIDDEMRALREAIAETAVQQIENARAQISAQASAAADMGRGTLKHISNRGTEVALELRREGVDPSSAAGQGRQNAYLAWQSEQQQLAAAQLAHARSIAVQAGDTGLIKQLDDELDGLYKDIAETATQQVEGARAQVRAAMDERVDLAVSRTTMADLGSDRLRAEQRLAKTTEGGAQQRYEQTMNVVIPAIQAEIETKKASQQLALEQGQTDLARKIGEEIYARETDVLTRQADALEEIEKNTNPKRVGGTLGFEYRGDLYTDMILDGVGS